MFGVVLLELVLGVGFVFEVVLPGEVVWVFEAVYVLVLEEFD